MDMTMHPDVSLAQTHGRTADDRWSMARASDSVAVWLDADGDYVPGFCAASALRQERTPAATVTVFAKANLSADGERGRVAPLASVHRANDPAGAGRAGGRAAAGGCAAV
jgi:hypothetical protein